MKHIYFLVLALLPVSLCAAVRTWTGGGGVNTNWTNASNWGGTAPSAGDDLVFTGAVVNTTLNNDFAAGTTFKSIRMTGATSSCSNFTLTGNAIVLSGGPTAILNDAGEAGLSGFSLRIDNNITFSTAAPTVKLDNTTNNRIILAGNINNGGYTITFDNIQTAGNITVEGVISGTGGLIKNNDGILELNGVNTYSGGTTLNRGTLRANNPSSFGSTAGTLTINGGSLRNLSAAALNDYVMVWNANFGIWGNNTNLGNGAVTMTTDISIDVVTGLRMTVGGPISGNYSLTKTGGGTLILNGANTYGKTTTISAGTIRVGSASALGSAAFGTVVAAGAALDVYGQNYTSNEPLTINTTAWGAIINSNTAAATFAGQVNMASDSYINASSGNISLTNAGGITGAGFKLFLDGAKNGTITGSVATASGTLTKQGTGMWTLAKNNTYTGATAISAGTLRLQGADNATPSYSIAASSVLDINLGANANYCTGKTVTYSGAGTLRKTGAGVLTVSTSTSYYNLSCGALIDIQAGSYICAATDDWTNNLAGLNVAASAVFKTGTAIQVIIDGLSGSGSVVVGRSGGAVGLKMGACSSNAAFGGIISNYDVAYIGNIEKFGTGAQTFSGANTYTGTTLITAGQIKLGAAEVLPNITALTVAAAGMLNLNSYNETVGSISGAGSIDNLTGAGSPTFTFGTNNQTTAFAGVMKNTTGVMNVTKTGTGTIYLDGDNTYYGQTYVEDGFVEIRNGSIISN